VGKAVTAEANPAKGRRSERRLLRVVEAPWALNFYPILGPELCFNMDRLFSTLLSWFWILFTEIGFHTATNATAMQDPQQPDNLL
jgi:hypothetical protein